MDALDHATWIIFMKISRNCMHRIKYKRSDRSRVGNQLDRPDKYEKSVNGILQLPE